MSDDQSKPRFLSFSARRGLVAALAMMGSVYGYVQKQNYEQAREALTTAEADRRGAERDKREALIYDCLNRRIDDAGRHHD